MDRDQRIWFPFLVICYRPVECASLYSSIFKRFGREQCFTVAMLLNENLRDLPKHLSPD